MNRLVIPLGFTTWAFCGVLQAATFTVTRLDDPLPNGCSPADCSLREAMIAANANPGTDRIVLAAGTHVLSRTQATGSGGSQSGGPLQPLESVQIEGAGVGLTLIRWQAGSTHANPLIQVESSVSAPLALELSGLALAGGRGEQGGCIRMISSSLDRHLLSLEQVRISGCASGSGGAAYLANTHLLMGDTTIEANTARFDGGALHLMGSTSVDTRRLTLANNQASRNGGAVALDGNGIIGWHTNVVWRDAGRSRISDNSAGGVGGGIVVQGTSSLNIATGDDVATGDWLQISSNRARSGGGVSLNAGLTDFSRSNRIRQVRLLGNSAQTGGALTSAASLQLSDSELAGNVARTGDGGAIALTGTFLGNLGRSLERLSLHDNLAAGGGGAIHSGCGSFNASDLSVHLNQAAAGRGQGIEVQGPAELRHVTLFANGSGSGLAQSGLSKTLSSQCPGTLLSYANSLFVDGCASAGAGLASAGGNQLGPAAISCPALAIVDARQTSARSFQLALGSWGGRFEVAGWAASAIGVPQRDFGQSSQCSQSDVFGRTRSDGSCDAGAFEQVVD